MWSRRQFIFKSLYSALGASALIVNHQEKAFSFAKHVKKNLAEEKYGLLAAEYWSPAIACDFIGVFDGDLCCILDEFGRFAIVNLLPNSATHILPVLGQLNNIGTRVLDCRILESKLAAVLAWSHISNSSATGANNSSIAEGQFSLILINLENPRAPQVISVIRLADYNELHTLAVNRSTICVGGLDTNREYRVSLFKFKKGSKLQPLSSFTVKYPIKNLLLGNQELLVLHENINGNTSATIKVSATLVDINNPKHPLLLQRADIVGDNVQIACCEESFVISRKLVSRYAVEFGQLKDFPQAKTQLDIDSAENIEAVNMDKTRLLLLSERNGESVVLPFAIDKANNLHKQNAINLKRHVKDDDKANKIVLGKNHAFIGAGWEGIQVLSATQTGEWLPTTYYSVPKLPVAGLINWSKYLLLAGADLRLYDLNKPEQPKLLNLVKLSSTPKAVISIDENLFCLDKNGIAVRKIDNPGIVMSNFKIIGDQLFADQVTKKLYLLHSNYLTELNWQEKIMAGKTIAVPKGVYCCSAYNDYIALANLDGISIFNKLSANNVAEEAVLDKAVLDKAAIDKDKVCAKQFTDLAWRQILLAEKNIFATAVDHNADGVFLIMSFTDNAINLLSSTKIPHDGVALTISKDRNFAYCVGQNSDGQSLLTGININNLSKPEITTTRPVLESASAVVVSDNLAFICGRGFEIFRL